MRHLLIICVLISLLSLIRAERKADESEVTKLEVVDLGEAEIEPDSTQTDIQRKRNSGHSYNRRNRIHSGSRFRIQASQSGGQILSKISGQLSRPFAKYGPPIQSTASAIAHAPQHPSKFKNSVGQQLSIGFDNGLVQQKTPSPIRNLDFAELNPIASQNDKPFGLHTANYLPPQNQKLPAYSSTDNFAPQSLSLDTPNHGQLHGTITQNQNFAQNQQISDAALFLSENARAIQQLYGAPASNQDFAPSYQFQNTGNQIQSPNGQFTHLESTTRNPQDFQAGLPAALSSYVTETLDSQKTLEQIQSLEKDRLIVQLQQALARAQTTTPTSDTTGRYAQNQANFLRNQELLASISQQIISRAPTTPQTVVPGNTVFSQSSFPLGTTVDPLGFRFNYGIPTTAQTPTTITTTATGASTPVSQPPLSLSSGTSVTSSLPASNQPGSPPTVPPVGIPLYNGFVPTFVTGTNFIPNFSTSVFASGPVRPVQPSPTHFGIPIPTETPEKPASTPSVPTATSPIPISPPNQAGVALTPINLPASSPLHPVAPLHPILPPNTAQVHPVQATPAVTSGVHPAYGLQPALINPVLYKPVKAAYPLYYYPNIAYQLQKPVLPGYSWSYATLHTQQKQPQVWK